MTRRVIPVGANPFITSARLHSARRLIVTKNACFIRYSRMSRASRAATLRRRECTSGSEAREGGSTRCAPSIPPAANSPSMGPRSRSPARCRRWPSSFADCLNRSRLPGGRMDSCRRWESFARTFNPKCFATFPRALAELTPAPTWLRFTLTGTASGLWTTAGGWPRST